MQQIAPDTFRLSFYRGYSPRQAMWFAASHPGDDKYKSAIQQAMMPVPTTMLATNNHSETALRSWMRPRITA